MRPSLQLARTVALATCLSLLTPGAVLGGTASDPDLFPVTTLEEAKAAHQGYRTLGVDLGSPGLSFEALVREGMEANVLARADAMETPGRELLATIFAPQDRNAFAISVVGFSPGFAAEAPAAAEQVLFEGGYGLADAAHENLVSGQAFGLIREGGRPARAARTLCDARGSVVLCFVMEFDAEHETEAMAQAAAFAGSLTYRDGGENAFDPEALTDIALALPDGGSLELTYPSAWAVADNAFARGESGTLQMHHGPADDPYSALVLTVSAGQAPTSPDGLEAAATSMVERYVENNASVLANPQLASRTGVRSAEPDAPFRSFAFIADKANGSGQAQLRQTLMAFGGLRYAVLMVTNYSPEVDGSGAFFVRWSATTAEDLAIESILRRRQ